MRTYPTKDDAAELKILNAENWQIELLKLNPEYVFWGCFEDYMCNDKGGWNSRVIQKTWEEHSDWQLDRLNELVNFYFEVYRKNHQCEKCEGSGLNQATKKLSDDWYSHLRTDGKKGWSNSLTDIEVEALAKSGRLDSLIPNRPFFNEEKNTWEMWVNGEKIQCEKPIYPSANEVNSFFNKGMGHDSINHWICTKARAKHLGIYGNCEHCIDGYVYDEETAKVALQLWYIHPRKGCSRGVYIEHITQSDLPSILEHLKEAAKRNQERFSKVF